jgi:NAD(P)-dependent dehydrogenase (short-subunit alcohol dehydrogenase family)
MSDVIVARGRILITGASTGIGHACAIHFAQLGYEVLAGVRKPADGDAFQAHALPNITPVLLDVTRQESIEGALAAAGTAPLAGLVNNAGIAVVGPVELVPIEDWRRQLDVNVIGLVAVIQACLPLLRRGRGRIVNIGSIAGRSALPGTAPYDASKFAIEAITDALRIELDPWGIRVSIIEPGAVGTPIWQKTVTALDDLLRVAGPDRYALYARLMARLRQEAEKPRSATAAAGVVKAVHHAMTARRPRTRYVVGRDARLWLLLNTLPDRWRDRLILGDLNR